MVQQGTRKDKKIITALLFELVVCYSMAGNVVTTLDTIDNNTCVNRKKTLLTQSYFSMQNKTYDIVYDYDLGGQSITLPQGCVLSFKGGSFCNGFLEGQNTKIENLNCDSIFSRDLHLRGTWDAECAYPEWFGAKGNGESEDTECIRRVIKHFNNIKFRSNATYLTNTVEVGSNKDIRGNSNSLLKCIGQKGIHYIFDIETGHNINIQNLSFDGNTTIRDIQSRIQSGAYYCIKIGSQKGGVPNNITIEDCTFTGSYNNAISNLKTEMAGADSIVIRNCRFHDVGWHGVCMNYWRNSIVSNCTFDRVGLHPIHKDGAGGGLGVDVSAGCENIIIDCNVVIDSPGGFKAETHDNDTLTSAKNIVFSNNFVMGRNDAQYSMYPGIKINGSNVICTHNYVTNVVGMGISLGVHSRRCTISSNIIKNTGLSHQDKAGLKIDGFGNHSVTNNIIINTNGAMGIKVRVSQNKIIGNYIQGASCGMGIYEGTNTIKDNKIRKCLEAYRKYGKAKKIEIDLKDNDISDYDTENVSY